MNYLKSLIIFIFLGSSLTVISQEVAEEKKVLIDELLVLTGAVDFGQLFSEIYISEMSNIISRAQPNTDPKVFAILEEEINRVIQTEIGDKQVFNELSYPIYNKYLTMDDIAELIAFYKTDLGKKTIAVMPAISQEATIAGQEWGKSLGPIIQQRIMTRFEEEGIEFN